MYWKDLMGFLKDAFPIKTTLAVFAVFVGFSFWGHYLTKEVVKPVTDPVVEVVESTIRPKVGPIDNTKAKTQDNSTVSVTGVSQEPGRVLLL